MSLKSIKKCDVEPVYLAGFKVIHIVYQGIFTCFYCLLNLYKNYINFNRKENYVLRQRKRSIST